MHEVAVFDNKMWVTGGFSNNVFNDVWYSEDGINWTESTADVGWETKTDHECLVFDNKMWVLGGLISAAPMVRSADVWYASEP